MPVLASRVTTTSVRVSLTTSAPSFIPPFRTKVTCPPPDDDLNETDGIDEAAPPAEQTRPSTITMRSRRIIDVFSANGLRAEWPATSSRHGRGLTAPRRNDLDMEHLRGRDSRRSGSCVKEKDGLACMKYALTRPALLSGGARRGGFSA